MPSHLTRRVIRCILANEPIVHRGCLRRQQHAAIRPTIAHNHHGRARVTTAPSPQQRSFFNFASFGRKRNEPREPDMDPGIDTMRRLEKMQKMRARLPSVEEVAAAYTQFFAFKKSKKQGIEDIEAQLALNSLRYCHDASPQKEARDPNDTPIGHVPLRHTILTLSRSLNLATLAHEALAKELWRLWEPKFPFSDSSRLAALVYVKLLSATDNPAPARDFTLHCEKLNRDRFATEPLEEREPLDSNDEAPVDEGDSVASGSAKFPRNDVVLLWPWVLRAYSKRNDEADILAVLQLLETRGITSDRLVAQSMLAFYLRQNNAEALKLWFGQYWDIYRETGAPKGKWLEETAADLSLVLRWCLQHGHLDFGHEIVRQTMADNPPKALWDPVFVWAAGTGKGADEIARMFTVMEKSNDAISDPEKWRVPDITTINGLVEYATSVNDPYLAERFIALGRERNIQPDARTYVLQIDYRLKVKDIDGALIAYKSLQNMDLSTNEDVPTVNKLIVALCGSKRHDFDTIMNVAGDLSDRRAKFEPLTVSKLALLHLSRDEIHDVIDLLNTHAYHYSSSERESIRNDIVSFCLDLKTPTASAWDAYTILRSIFEEMPRSQRTEIMVGFFKRERPDLAVHVFGGMRAQSRDDLIPTVDTYVTAFLGCARLRELESLEVLHNQLKLDFNIDPTTYLYNSLIIAYTACGKPRKALDFWDAIVASKEGPTYNSIHIALRACEKSPFGDVRAQGIWDKLRKQKVDLDQALWASYIAALAGNGDNALVTSTIEEADAKNELEVDAFLIGSFITAAPGQNKQEEVEAWCKDKYPHVWANLEEIGFEVAENDMKTAKIDRTVTP